MPLSEKPVRTATCQRHNGYSNDQTPFLNIERLIVRRIAELHPNVSLTRQVLVSHKELGGYILFSTSMFSSAADHQIATAREFGLADVYFLSLRIGALLFVMGICD
jgi:hypothetical protein